MSLVKSPLIMGILNVTPDSFSDGGHFNHLDDAINHAKQMINDGADIIDIGAESTRPGAKRVDADTQIARSLPVIEALRETLPSHTRLSIDTTLSKVAETAISAGAMIVNDVSGGRDDPKMFSLVAKCQCDYVIMHMQGTPMTMQDDPHYEDIVTEVKTFLLSRAELCMKEGVNAEHIILDPGIGFGKTYEHNLSLLANLSTLTNEPYAVLLGSSRKRFMAAICEVNEPIELLGATTATTALGVQAGVQIFRVHDVKANRQAADVAWQITHN